MGSEKLTFPGAFGDLLAGRLERPAGPVRTYALFAHCVTCGKDIRAATTISLSRALAQEGIGVPRFDFTGLGSSDGDFANTTFSSDVDAEATERDGEAVVAIAGRAFRIKREFLENLREADSESAIASLARPLLILRSPVDTVVSVDNAGRIFAIARHPKSFVSLDDADHLLSRSEDAAYVARILFAWPTRYL